MASTTPNPLQIPVVDINGPDSQQSIADQLVNAATVHGFVYIKNLGKDILIKDIDHAFDLVLPVRFHERNSFANLYTDSPKNSLLHPLKRRRKSQLERM